MKKTLPFAVLMVLPALGLPAVPAQAQLARTYVSAEIGNDANDCNRLTPCRTFQTAHDKTLTKGEITVLDAGGYGAVTITKAISITNDGTGEAGVLVSGGAAGITIAVGAIDAVSLRGLTVKGIGFGGGDGIRFTSGRSLSIDNCVIRSLDGSGGNGILFQPTGTSRLLVSNTLVTDNITHGIVLDGKTILATLDRVHVHASGQHGITMTATNVGAIFVAVTDSIVAGNFATGIRVTASSGAALATVIRSTMVGNTTGVTAEGAAATVRLGQSTLIGNSSSWATLNGGTLRSYGDNSIDGNGDGDPAPPVTPRK